MEKREFTVKEKLNNLSVLADSVSAKSGWSKLKAIREMRRARKEIGVPYIIYDRYNFFNYTPEEQKEQFRIFTEHEEKQREEKAARHKVTREKAIEKIMAESGWSRKETVKALKRSLDLTGIGSRHYVAFKFWELDDEAQKTYFTIRHSNQLKEKYTDQYQGKTMMSNKDAFNTFFGEYIGRKWAEAGCSFEEFCEKFADESKVIYKPIGLSGGTGIRAFELGDGRAGACEDRKASAAGGCASADGVGRGARLKAVYDEISGLPEGIVESFIVQHPEMAKLSKKSVNTIRVVTIMTHDKKKGIETDEVHILYAGMRMGRGDGILDNLHAGGLIAGIDLETGIIATDGVDYENNVFEVHPDTGVKIKGFKIPYFEEVKQMIKEAGLKAEGYYGWDVAITEDGPILIEANTSPGPGILQIPYALEKKGMKYVVEKYL